MMDTQTLLRLAIRLRPYVDLADADGEDRNIPVPSRLHADLIRETGAPTGAAAVEHLLAKIRSRPDWKDLLLTAAANADLTERIVVPHATYARFCRHFYDGRDTLGGCRDLGDGRVEMMVSADTVRDLCDAADEADPAVALEKLLSKVSQSGQEVEYRMSPALARSFIEEYPQYSDTVGADGVFRGFVTDAVARRAGYATKEECAAAVKTRIAAVEERMRGVEVDLSRAMKERLALVRKRDTLLDAPGVIGTDAAANVRNVWGAAPVLQTLSILEPQGTLEKKDTPRAEPEAALVNGGRILEWKRST